MKLKDALGVCVHMSYPNTRYTSAAQVRFDLDTLGINSVRDRSRLAIAIPGVKSTIICLNDSEASLALAAGAHRVDGPNEQNKSTNPNWVTDLRAMYPKIQAICKGKIQALSPSIMKTLDADCVALGQLPDCWGSLHIYPGSNTVDQVAARLDTAMASLYKVVDKWNPIVITETGFSNGIIGADANAVTEQDAADKLLPWLLEIFKRGIEQVYLYQLYNDPTASPANGGHENNFGLFDEYGDIKPIGTEVNRIIARYGEIETSALPFYISVEQALGI